MADHGEVEYATADGNDYSAHEQTYRTFIHLVKGVLAVVVVILILMAISWSEPEAGGPDEGHLIDRPRATRRRRNHESCGCCRGRSG